MKKLPPFLKKYFWDVDFAKLNPQKYPFFVIERILEYGNDKSAEWLFKRFSRTQLKQTLSKRRGISRRSANYWALILDIPKHKISCFKRRHSNILKKPLFYEMFYEKTWPY